MKILSIILDINPRGRGSNKNSHMWLFFCFCPRGNRNEGVNLIPCPNFISPMHCKLKFDQKIYIDCQEIFYRSKVMTFWKFVSCLSKLTFFFSIAIHTKLEMSDISINSLAGNPILVEGERATYIVSKKILSMVIYVINDLFLYIFW